MGQSERPASPTQFSPDSSLNTAVTMGKGQNEGFSEEQLQMYKDCFKMMDINKDGTIDKNDLRGAFDNVGVLMTESELDDLLGEVGGACTYDNMVKMFQEKMAGDGNDPDDLIVQAFKAYDLEGKIDSKMFQHALMAWETRCPRPRLTTSSASSRSMRTTASRPRRLSASSSPSRRRRRRSRRPPHLWRRLPWRRTRVMPRRRRRRRRRPPSKCKSINIPDQYYFSISKLS